ncbi:hypothetical protein [Pseudomonas sp. ESBL1]|uniref:hypothetical protein n=1 Tax=Pseudomonas sp. ESBL1 TaxID=3077324 RepID=UPI002FC712B8
MYTQRYLSSLLRSLLVGALLGVPTLVFAESAAVGGGLDTSAIAMYQRSLSDSGLHFGLRKVEKSTAFLIDSGNDAAPALLVGSGHAVLDVFDQVATQLTGIGLVRFRTFQTRPSRSPTCDLPRVEVWTSPFSSCIRRRARSRHWALRL